MIHSFHFLFLKYRSMAGKSEYWEAFCEFRGKLHKDSVSVFIFPDVTQHLRAEEKKDYWLQRGGGSHSISQYHTNQAVVGKCLTHDPPHIAPLYQIPQFFISSLWQNSTHIPEHRFEIAVTLENITRLRYMKAGAPLGLLFDQCGKKSLPLEAM